MGRFIDITGEVFGKFTVVRRLNEKSNGHILWECKCECGSYINKTRGNLIKMKKQCCAECSKIDLTGDRFGKLTVIEETQTVKIGSLDSRAWKCRCDCGEKLIVAMPYLRKKKTKSCKKCYKPYNFKDLSNKKFDRLIVSEKYKKVNNRVFWECLCDCGTKTEVSTYNLLNGKVRSCGCYVKEAAIRNITAYNDSPFSKGTHHHAYKPTLSETERLKNRTRMSDLKYKRWSVDVKKRDDFKCRICSESKSNEMVSHHLNGWHWFEEGRFDVDNGVTLCESCHLDFHNKYGYGNNTEAQFEEFYRNDIVMKSNKS